MRNVISSEVANFTAFAASATWCHSVSPPYLFLSFRSIRMEDHPQILLLALCYSQMDPHLHVYNSADS